jgi:hypothetical protein
MFSSWRDKKGKKKKTTTDNKLFIIYHHAPYQEKDDTVMLPKTQREDKFGYQVVSHPLSK